MKNITIVLPEGYLKQMENLIAKANYPSRSEIVRQAIDEFLHREKGIHTILEGVQVL